MHSEVVSVCAARASKAVVTGFVGVMARRYTLGVAGHCVDPNMRSDLSSSRVLRPGRDESTVRLVHASGTNLACRDAIGRVDDVISSNLIAPITSDQVGDLRALRIG